jgi:hypothetical protein
VANAVRDELVLAAEPVEDPVRIARHGLTKPYVDARYEFGFAPAVVAAGA